MEVRKLVLLFALLTFGNNLYAQSASKFDSIYQIVFEKAAGNDAPKVLHLADSLILLAENDSQKISSYMLSVSILRQIGNRNKAIETALKAEKISYENNLYNWNARICGQLSTLYRENGLPIYGKHYLEKALLASRKIEDKNHALRFQGNLQQERAYYEMNEENYRAAIQMLKKGDSLFYQMDKEANRDWFLAVNAELIGKNYFSLNELDSAKLYYERGIRKLSSSDYKQSTLKGFIYNGLGNVYFAQKDYENAGSFYDQALEIAEISQFMALKAEVYNSLLNYFKTTGDSDQYIVYNEKYLQLNQQSEQTSKASANKIIREISKNHQEVENRQKVVILVSVIMVILIFGGSVYFFRVRKKKYHQRFQEVLRKLNEKNSSSEDDFEEQPENEELENRDARERLLITKETEIKLLEALKKFEKSERFLDKDISLSVLAGRIGTNTKYLSYVINTHKKKDFSTYINEMRIYYIINKLKNNPAYSNYKISYLAEECGFSSHSKFTTKFKSVTGMAPSVFLEHLNKELV